MAGHSTWRPIQPVSSPNSLSSVLNSRLLVVLIQVVAALRLGNATLRAADDSRTVTNQTAVQQLARAINENYSYRDRLGIDWTMRLEEFKPLFAAVGSADEFADVTAKFFAQAKDVHIWINVGQRVVGTYQRNYQLNFNPRVLPRLIPTLEQHGKTVLVGSFKDGIQYVAIGTWDHREPNSMKAAIAAIHAAAQSKSPIIIDVRPNSGGDEVLARDVAAFFVSEPTVCSQHFTRSAGRDSQPVKREVRPRSDGVHHPGPCVVLMGPANISSCESFLLMMRVAGCTLIGAKSGGSSGNPKPHDLGNGVTVMLPSWRDQTLDGKNVEGMGIEPDMTTDAEPAKFKWGDPVLFAALEHLRQQKTQ